MRGTGVPCPHRPMVYRLVRDYEATAAAVVHMARFVASCKKKELSVNAVVRQRHPVSTVAFVVTLALRIGSAGSHDLAAVLAIAQCTTSSSGSGFHRR